MIPIKNVYHMLSYAFQTLQNQGYRSLATEDFENVADLCAAILCKGVADQIRQGLGRAYVRRTESMSCPRGQIEMAQSIQSRAILKRQLVCSYDEFSVDFEMNRLIDQIFASIVEYVDGKLVCGAGGGGFLQEVLKKGVTRAQVHAQLKEIFQDSNVDVFDADLI